MPPMGSFHNRYYMMIAPYMAILSILYVNYILNFMKIKKNYKIIILFVFIFVNSMCYDYKSKSAYAFTLTKEEVQILNKIKNKKVFLDAREVCGTKVYFRGEEYAEENRVMVGWIHSLACILKDANEIFISNDICSEASLQQIIDGDFSIIMTPLTWGRKNMESLKRDCFEKLGFTQKYKFCASEFCNYLYERK